MTNSNTSLSPLYAKAAAAGYADEETGQVDDFFVDCWLADTATFDVLPRVERIISHAAAVTALRYFDGDVDAAVEWLDSD